MSDREPEAWESSEPEAFLRIEKPRGVVEVWAGARDRFWIRAPGHEEVVAGVDAAHERAHELAEQLR